MEKGSVRDTILNAMAEGLEAQLRAVRRLRGTDKEKAPKRSGMSHTDMAHDVLEKAEGPLHINEILARIERIHHVKLDRESVGSALVKRVAREDRFVRTAANTFGLIERDR
jgi:hypothetical protein